MRGACLPRLGCSSGAPVQAKAKSRSKATDRSVRPTRAALATREDDLGMEEGSGYAGGYGDQFPLALEEDVYKRQSASIADRFKFEQDAATNFMQKVVTGQNDLAFVIGFANSVLLVQDFTGEMCIRDRPVAHR